MLSSSTVLSSCLSCSNEPDQIWQLRTNDAACLAVPRKSEAFVHVLPLSASAYKRRRTSQNCDIDNFKGFLSRWCPMACRRDLSKIFSDSMKRRTCHSSFTKSLRTQSLSTNISSSKDQRSFDQTAVQDQERRQRGLVLDAVILSMLSLVDLFSKRTRDSFHYRRV